MLKIAPDTYINRGEVLFIMESEGKQQEKILAAAKENGTVLDFTMGKKTHSLIVLRGGTVLRSPVLPETLVARMERNAECTATAGPAFPQA